MSGQFRVELTYQGGWLEPDVWLLVGYLLLRTYIYLNPRREEYITGLTVPASLWRFPPGTLAAGVSVLTDLTIGGD